MALQIDKLTTVPTPHPLEVEWQYNGDFWEIGYYSRRPWGKGTREAEWIVLAQVNLGCSMDEESPDTWKVVQQIGCLMASAPRMRTALARMWELMAADESSYTFADRTLVYGALRWAESEAEN